MVAKNQKKIKCDFNPSYRWHNLANAYLDLADTGLSHVEIKKDFKVILPIIYCIKHGLELYLKGLNVESDYVFSQIHNQKELFSKIYSQLSFSTENSEQNKRVLLKFIKIVKNYRSNLIGGQQLFNSDDDMNDKFRYLQEESYVYSKLRDIDINQVRVDIKNIKFFGNLLSMGLQVSKNKLNTAIFFDNKVGEDMIWSN